MADGELELADKGFCLVTYRSSWLRPSVLAAADVVLLARTTLPEELAFLPAFVEGKRAGSERAVAMLGDLPEGQFVMIQADGTGPASFVPAPRVTLHVRHLRKYADSTVGRELRFVFRGPDGGVVGSADSLRAFRRAVETVDDAVLAHHAARADFSRWVLDVFADRELSAALRKAEARWLRGELPNLRRSIAESITMRYGAEP